MKKWDFAQYKNALDGVGPTVKELILERAANDTEGITFREFIRLCKLAYPETM